MTRSDTLGWFAAVLLSLLAHSMMFMQSGAHLGSENAPALHAPLITRLSFNQLVVTPPDEVLPVTQQRQRVVKKIEPEKIRAKQKIKIEQPVEAVEASRQLASPAQVKGKQVSQSSEGLLQREHQHYLHKLLSHIESNKFYPRAARRRSVEGNVKISFVLRDDGYYEQLELDGEHSVLVKAARNALQSSLPLPQPTKDSGLSRKIEFSMVYSLAD